MSYKIAARCLPSIAGLISALVWVVTGCHAQQIKRPFTVVDEIELALGENVKFSPNGRYFAVYSERGRLDLNRPEDSLRFYCSHDVETFLVRSNGAQPPSPLWIVTRSTGKEGPIINDPRWLADSSGMAFLERMASGNQRLVIADLHKKKIEPLTSATEMVKTFDIRDRRHFVYTVVDPHLVEKRNEEHRESAILGTDRPINELLFPDDLKFALFEARSYLWAFDRGKRFEIKRDGVPVVFFGNLELSPNGHSLVTSLPVADVPTYWETLYPPSVGSSQPIRAGHYDVQSHDGPVHQYVRIDLQTGSIQPLTDAPISNDLGWWVLGDPSWSNDGQAILLPGTFLNTRDGRPSRPCVAVVELALNTQTCVEMLKGHTETGVEDGFHLVSGVRFADDSKSRVMVAFVNHEDQELRTTEYRRLNDNTWQVVRSTKGALEAENSGVEVSVRQGLNDPPVLVATNKQVSKVIWDPNPHLTNIELGAATVYTWTDKEGRKWQGGLYKPSNYKSEQHYPLVIQTHGFAEWEFTPSGIYPTAFAARALAAAGIVVLQVSEKDCPRETPDEGTCAASGYEAAATKLVSEGLVNPERIGIIGFSRTCFYVMQTLTSGSLHIRAASITDGVMEDYLQYMLTEQVADDGNSMIGARPFGEGLQQWLKRSPGFNLDKVNAPLLVVGEGPLSLLFMWQPYAGLRYLHKPVDLIMLNTDEHVLTNPAARLASQGGSVDWFTFWLKGEEDPNPAKAKQYARWRMLRNLQAASDKAR